MEKVSLGKQNLTPTFIGSWTMSPLSTCDGLIDYFELNKNKQKQGVTGDGINLDVKNSTDQWFKVGDMLGIKGTSQLNTCFKNENIVEEKKIGIISTPVFTEGGASIIEVTNYKAVSGMFYFR